MSTTQPTSPATQAPTFAPAAADSPRPLPVTTARKPRKLTKGELIEALAQREYLKARDLCQAGYRQREQEVARHQERITALVKREVGAGNFKLLEYSYCRDGSVSLGFSSAEICAVLREKLPAYPDRPDLDRIRKHIRASYASSTPDRVTQMLADPETVALLDAVLEKLKRGELTAPGAVEV